MNIAGLTIEIWEMTIVVSLFLVIGFIGAQISNPDFQKSEAIAKEIKYLGYLNENIGTETKINLENDAILSKNSNNEIEVKINDIVSFTKISKDLINIKKVEDKIIIS